MHPKMAADYIRTSCPNFIPRLGLILGSGLGPIAEQMEIYQAIPYAELPGFPISTVAGHAGRLLIGKFNDTPIICLQGRTHSYEGTGYEGVKIMIRTLKLLGCEGVVLTNAAGSLRPEVKPGELMLINDHINLQPGNPLQGQNDEEFGPRFFPLDDAYDLDFQQRLLAVAEKLSIRLTKGVYISILGPNFETPAEIRAFRLLGADAVGMSSVPEVLVARHCGLRVMMISAITNLAAGLSIEPINHEETLHFGGIAATSLVKLLKHFIAGLN